MTYHNYKLSKLDIKATGTRQRYHRQTSIGSEWLFVAGTIIIICLDIDLALKALGM